MGSPTWSPVISWACNSIAAFAPVVLTADVSGLPANERAALDNFNFGESEIVEIGPGRSQVVFHEVPQPLGSWFLPTMAGYAGVLIERAGGKKPVVNGRLIPKGQRDAIGLVDVRVNLTWV